MPPKQSIPAEIRSRAAQRDHLLTRSELLTAGLSRHTITRLSQGWTTLAPGVYAVRPPTWRTYLRAGLHIAGEQAAAFGPTALLLYGVDAAPAPVHVMVPLRDSRRTFSWVRFVRCRLGSRHVAGALDLRRTSLEDAVLDTCTQLDERSAGALVIGVVQSRRTTPQRLLMSLAGRERLRHRAALQAILADAASGVHSVLELRYAKDVERAHGLPTMRRQFAVAETGCIADLGHEQHRLLIELDGAAFHDPSADRRRDNLHGNFAYRTLRFTWDDVVYAPCATARLVAGALGLGSPPRRCRHCRTAS